MCDLCHYLLGRTVPETLLHVIEECPFSAPVVTTIWREFFGRRAQPHTQAPAAALTPAEYLDALRRRTLLGTPDFDPDPFQSPTSLRDPIAILSAATNHALITRRNNNAFNTSCPIQFEAGPTVDRILRTVCAASTALRKTARRREDSIYCTYAGWLPDDEKLPTTIWRNAWIDSGLLRNTHPSASPTLPAVAVDATPTVDLSNAQVAARIQLRKAPQPPPPAAPNAPQPPNAPNAPNAPNNARRY